MSTLLLYPPVTDPTSGYHSLIYLETYARQQGFTDIDILDTNIEGFLYSLRPEQISALQQHMQSRRQELESRPSLHAEEQIELAHIWKAQTLDPADVLKAIDTLRDPDAFYEYAQYRPAVEKVISWLSALSLLGYPGQFQNFSLTPRTFYNISSTRDMADPAIAARMTAPFDPYLQNVLIPQIAKNEYRTVGINITYVAQLPFALAIGRMIRQEFPDIVILFGGTEVADCWKYMTDKNRFFDVFDCADACVIGEGELAFTALLRMVEAGDGFTPLPNVYFHPKHQVTDELPVIQYIDITDLPTPDYSKLRWDLYLAPEPFVYYSPSRGCYWNKCTFCDYGLNEDSPTSPWRHYSLEKIVEDMRTISQNFKFIYFSVDVLSPATLLHLAERLIEEQIDIRWGAEIRLEKYWSPERAELLRRSGCIAISVGFESGNQRILNLIDKGTQVQRVEEVIQNFHAANIAVQIMGFTNFPTETFEEGMESVQFLERMRSQWTLGGLGTFALTPGAIAAKNPETFHLVNVQPFAGEDIKRQLYFEDPAGYRTPEQAAQLDAAKSSLHQSHFGRPWVGGVDASHSFFYHDAFGVNILKPLQQLEEADFDQVLHLNGRVVTEPSGYPLQKLIQLPQLIQFRTDIKNTEVRGLVAEEIATELHKRVLRRSEAAPKRYFIRHDLHVFAYSEAVYQFLELFTNGNTMNDVLQQAGAEERDLYIRLFRQCLSRHFLTMQSAVPELSAV